MHNIFLVFIFLISTLVADAGGILKGTVTDEKGEAIPYANVWIKNTTYGVVTDVNGRYFMELKNGNHIIVFSFLGYETIEKEILMQEGKMIVFNVKLHEKPYSTEEVVISPDKRDLTKSIIQKAREKRKDNFDALKNYTCQTYMISSLEKIKVKFTKTDSLIMTDSVLKKKMSEIHETEIKDRLNLIESLSKTYFYSPHTIKEFILAYHDYSDKKITFDQTISAQISYGEAPIAPIQAFEENNSLIFKDLNSCLFDFYANEIEFSGLCQKPLLSPLAYNSGLYYKYELLGSFYEEKKLVYKISVKPLFKTEPLFEGTLFIEDSSFALIGVDLKIDKSTMLIASEFRIIQNYELINGCFLPVRRELFYTIEDGAFQVMGNSRINHTGYKVNFSEKDEFSNNEIKKFAEDAFNKDSLFWTNNRGITLKEEEKEFISTSDSIQKYYASDEFLDIQDSAFNRIGWYTPFTGIGHSNHYKGYKFFIEGIISQINPFGIGGYRHRLSGFYQQRFKNNLFLETEEFIDYGFRNNDVKAKVGAGLTYYPLKFVRTFIRVGDYYEWVNNYASFEQIFSRSNYVRTKNISISQRMEVINGLFAELNAMYSRQTPIKNLKQDKWSDLFFGKINEPIDFDPYTKFEIRLNIEYRFGQKYYIKGNRKYILENEYPTFKIVYRKGIPAIFGSEVNFDYVELDGKDDFRFARWGTIRWEFNMGSFLNKQNLRLLEYKYFRGSDHYFFSDPLNSFQLLGPSLSTPNTYIKAAVIHHFERSITDKIPLINLLKLDIAAGAGTLVIPDDNFSHAEMFAGLERIFRIKDQLLRIGVYAVTSDNNLDTADFTVKFGLDFYNSFTDKWNY